MRSHRETETDLQAGRRKVLGAHEAQAHAVLKRKKQTKRRTDSTSKKWNEKGEWV